jgi:catecholate siderophore receptor
MRKRRNKGPATQSAPSQLPPVQIDEPTRKQKRQRSQPSNRAGATAARRTTTPQPTPVAGGIGLGGEHLQCKDRHGRHLHEQHFGRDEGEYAAPQYPAVALGADTGFYQRSGVLIAHRRHPLCPGVAVHQGEGNRDELVIRGVDSSANFFVNGFRDDVQYFRDLYNAQSVEILKGPSALTFGRGAGGGLLDRTLKEADGQRIYEVTGQTGSYWDRRVTLDAGQAVNDNFAARLNLMYEGSDTFRDYGWLERWGVNPTVTFRISESTKIRLSYEYYQDMRVADRGNPSQGLSAVAPSSTRFNPAAPFAPGGDLTAFFGSPGSEPGESDRAGDHGVYRPRFRKRTDRAKRDDVRAVPEVLSERLSGQWSAVGRSQSRPDFV